MYLEIQQMSQPTSHNKQLKLNVWVHRKTNVCKIFVCYISRKASDHQNISTIGKMMNKSS